jgi:hypothetical protein
LFAKFFQGVYVNDGQSIPLSTLEALPNDDQNSHKVSLIQMTETAVENAILESDEQKGPGPDGIVYHIGGHNLERVNEIKDLGVFLDSRMTLLNHIETIIAKSSRRLGFIKGLLYI